MSPFHRVSIAALTLSMLLSARALAEEPVVAPKPMANEDVVLLSKLGLGDEVVLAKIQSAPAVAFRTEVADLEQLQKEGVSAAVITAMVKRQAGEATGATSPVIAGAAGLETKEEGTVALFTKDKGEVALSSMAGTFSSTYAFVTVLMHSNFEGMKAATRTTDRQPSLVVRSGRSPVGRMYFVVAEVDKDDRVRSVKLGNMGVFKVKNMYAPDKDNRIDCDVAQEGAEAWRLTPKKALKPGEYGLWFASSTGGASAGGGEMFDFGVD